MSLTDLSALVAFGWALPLEATTTSCVIVLGLLVFALELGLIVRNPVATESPS